MLVLTVAMALGVVVGVVIAVLRHRVVRERLATEWADRFRRRETESARANHVASKAVRESQSLRESLTTATTALARREAEMLTHARELDALRTVRDQALRSAEVAREELTIAGARLDAAVHVERRLATAERELRLTREQLKFVSGEEQENAATCQRLEADSARLAIQVETLLDELRQAAAAAETERSRHQSEVRSLEAAHELNDAELAAWKRRAVDAEQIVRGILAERDSARQELARGSAELARRDLLARNLEVGHQTRIAELSAELGSLAAQVERLDPLRRQLEDRDALVLAMAHERDEAHARLVRRERDLRAEIARLESALRDLHAREAALSARVNQLAALEPRLTILTRERDGLAAATTQRSVEIQTLRTEIRDRDRRFVTLLEDRRAVVEGFQAEIDRQNRTLAEITNGTRDNLRRINGIGAVLNRKLRKLGITTFSQIAEWTDDDIDWIARAIGTFAARIRRENWIEQAKDEHERAYGERL